MEEIRDAYDEEKQEYDAHINLLKEEIEELHRELEREEMNRKKMDDLSKANKLLQQEKRKVTQHFRSVLFNSLPHKIPTFNDPKKEAF